MSFLAVLSATLACRAANPGDLTIYTDYLVNGFQDGGKWAPHSLTNTSPVHSGTYSIAVLATSDWQALSFRTTELDTTPYASVSFWINGGTNGGQRLQVQAKIGKADPELYYRLVLLPNIWQQITVPLSSLNAVNKSNLTSVWIQMIPGSPTDPFYVDDVQFDAKPAAAMAMVVAPAAPVVSSVPVEAPAHEAGTRSGLVGWCIAGALIIITGLLAWLVAMLRRSGVGAAREVIPVATLAPINAPLPTTHLDARSRAVVEVMNDPQSQALREKMASELSEFAKQSLVQELFSQRNKLVETQQKAQAELAELEARLSALNLPLQERIRAYEKRIAELEAKLETRDEEMHGIIQASLLLVRERLEKEKGESAQSSRFN